jgi:hypothetical protein
MRLQALLAVVLLVIGVMPLSAQDQAADNGLLEMLALVPNIPPSREYLSYIDYRALFAARPGSPQPTTAEAFDAVMANHRSDERALMTSAFSSASAGPYFYASALYSEPHAMQEFVGFHITDIEQALEFGKPTYGATILKGSFDNAAIIAAHMRRGYSHSNLDDLTLLCPEGGCQNGLLADQYERTDANPFGGNIGRNQVVLLGDGWIASSPDIDTILSIAQFTVKLADAPDYRAAAESLHAQGTIVQAQFVHPSDQAVWYYILIDIRTLPRNRPAAAAEFRETFVPIHSYNLLVLAHTATESEERAVAAMVYVTKDSAEYSAPILLDRLDTYENYFDNQIWGEAMAARGVTATDANIYPASGRRFVVNVTFHSPLPGTDVPSTGIAEVPARPFSYLIRNYHAGMLNWLVAGARVPYLD